MTIVDGCAAVRADVQAAIRLPPTDHRLNYMRHGPFPRRNPIGRGGGADGCADALSAGAGAVMWLVLSGDWAPLLPGIS